MNDLSPVRVLRIITRLNIGGPTIHATRLSTALTTSGFSTRLVHGSVGPEEGDMAYVVKDGTDLRYVPALQRAVAPLLDLRALFALYREINDFRPHIVHTHMAKAGLLGRLAAILFNLTHPRSRAIVIHTYHGHVLLGYFSPLGTAMVVGIERLLAHGSDVLISVSNLVRTELVSRYRIGRPERFKVVALGLDLDGFAALGATARAEARAALKIAPNIPVVTTVGRLTPIKEHTLFLDVAKRIATTRPDALFLIVGDGNLRPELEEAARQRGIASRVRFLGWRRDLATIYGASDVFLLTSRNEGTPVALIEAMAAGVPGVATDVGGVRDVIPDADRGRVYAFGDADGLAEGVVGLLADQATRERVGAAARESALARFRFGRLAQDIEALYRELLER